MYPGHKIFYSKLLQNVFYMSFKTIKEQNTNKKIICIVNMYEVFWHKEKAKDQLVFHIIIIDVIRWNLPLKFREGSSQMVVFSNRSIKMLWIPSPDLLSVPMYLSALDVELHRYWDVSTFYFHKAGPFQFSLKQALRSSLVFNLEGLIQANLWWFMDGVQT